MRPKKHRKPKKLGFIFLSLFLTTHRTKKGTSKTLSFCFCFFKTQCLKPFERKKNQISRLNSNHKRWKNYPLRSLSIQYSHPAFIIFFLLFSFFFFCFFSYFIFYFFIYLSVLFLIILISFVVFFVFWWMGWSKIYKSRITPRNHGFNSMIRLVLGLFLLFCIFVFFIIIVGL